MGLRGSVIFISVHAEYIHLQSCQVLLHLSMNKDFGKGGSLARCGIKSQAFGGLILKSFLK